MPHSSVTNKYLVRCNRVVKRFFLQIFKFDTEKLPNSFFIQNRNKENIRFFFIKEKVHSNSRLKD